MCTQYIHIVHSFRPVVFSFSMVACHADLVVAGIKPQPSSLLVENEVACNLYPSASMPSLWREAPQGHLLLEIQGCACLRNCEPGQGWVCSQRVAIPDCCSALGASSTGTRTVALAWGGWHLPCEAEHNAVSTWALMSRKLKLDSATCSAIACLCNMPWCA